MTTLIRNRPTIDHRLDALASLIDELHAALRDRPTGLDAAIRAADCLTGSRPTPDLLTIDEQAGDPDAYRQHVLFVDARVPFSIVALVWRPGQQTTIHDHRCWGAVAVLEGAEHETLYALGDDEQLRPGQRTVYPAGFVSAFAPPGDIHRVRNGGPGTAISLHVYGADIAVLGSSIRRSYPENSIAA
jgi:predicted metal-dependent enzyme (double-stranded beta helix superfamily)